MADQIVDYGSFGFIVAFITFVVTHLTTVYRMKRRFVEQPGDGNGYRLRSESVECQKERKEAESNLLKILGRMEKRMILGNLVMTDLVEANDDIPNDRIKRYEADLGIDSRNKDLGIP